MVQAPHRPASSLGHCCSHRALRRLLFSVPKTSASLSFGVRVLHGGLALAMQWRDGNWGDTCVLPSPLQGRIQPQEMGRAQVWVPEQQELQLLALLSSRGGSSRRSSVETVALGWLSHLCGAGGRAGHGKGGLAPTVKGARAEARQAATPPACPQAQWLPWPCFVPLLPSLSQSRRWGSGLGWCCPGLGCGEDLRLLQSWGLRCRDPLSFSQDPRCWCLALPGA